MRILVSGATGLIGSHLVPRLRAAGHDVLRMSRGAEGDDVVRWDPRERELDRPKCAGVEAVVHLAGENIAGGRWSERRMLRIRDSRVAGTRFLVEELARLDPLPRVWVGASGVHAYGESGDAVLTEGSGIGGGFLADLCREWEAASEPIEAAGARRVVLRMGMVLDAEQGALAKMLTPFKLGVAGKVGSGDQWWSWITVTDVCRVIERALTDATMAGIYNCVAPQPVTNRDFTRALGRVVNRPTLVPLPAFAARLALGKMADALLLTSTRAVPQRLEQSGFTFDHPTLEPALRHLLY